MWCVLLPEKQKPIPLLTDSEEETIVLIAELNALLMAKTRSGQSYLKKYDDMVANLPKPASEPAK